MKKFFHLAVVAIAATAFVSCSKSSDQLATSTTNESAVSMKRSRDAANPWEMWIKVFNEINQPRPVVLGNPDSYLYDGEQPVFYFIISSDVTSDAYTGTVNLVDEATGNIIQTVNLLPDYDPAGVNLDVPAEVSQFHYMFAPVTIDSQFAGKTVSFQATIQLPTGEVANATLQNAFVVQ